MDVGRRLEKLERLSALPEKDKMIRTLVLISDFISATIYAVEH